MHLWVLTTSPMYLDRFRLVMSLVSASSWLSVILRSFFTNAVHFLRFESSLVNVDSSGRLSKRTPEKKVCERTQDKKRLNERKTKSV